MKLIVMIGPPGCGKSRRAAAWEAQQPGRVVVCPDAIRAQLYGDAVIQGDWPEIWQEVQRQWRVAIAQGAAGVLYDATNADRLQRQVVVATGRSLGFDPLEGWWLQTDLATCLARNQARDRRVPPEVIERMVGQLAADPPSLAEGFDRLRVL